MDCRLTASFFTTQSWSTVKLWPCCILILLLHVVVLRIFRSEVAPKGHTLIKIYRIQTSPLPENKQLHIEQGKFQTFHLSCPERQRFYIVIVLLICCQYVFAPMFMTLLTAPLATLSLNWLVGVCTVCCTHWLITLSLWLVFIFAQVIRNYIKQKWAERVCAICSPEWQNLGVGEDSGKEDWFHACETPQENQYAHPNPRLT